MQELVSKRHKAKKEALAKGGIFIPLLFSFAARLEDIPLPQFLGDPTKIANAIRSVQSYYRLKGVTCYCDPTLEAEALGCELDWGTHPPRIIRRQPIDSDTKARAEKIAELGRIPTALEVVNILDSVLGDVILLAAITGPFTLARNLTDPGRSPEREALELALRVTLILIRRFGEIGLNVPLIREDQLPQGTDEAMQTVKSIYAPIWNTAKFYGMHPVLSAKNAYPSGQSLFQIADCATVSDLTGLNGNSAQRIAYALSVPSLTETREDIQSRLERDLPQPLLASGRIFMITTDEEIPLNTDAEALIKGMEAVQNYLDVGI